VISRKTERSFERRKGRRKAEVREGYEGRLNRVLAAATGVIARDGYEGASMRAVAREAGVSLAGLYHYLDSKEQMLFLIQSRTFRALVDRIREKLHGVRDPVEQLRALVRTNVDYFAANMEALKVCARELDSLHGEAYAQTGRIRREYYDLTRGIIDRILNARGAARRIDRHVATMSLFGTLNWLYRWYAPKRGSSPATVAAQISTQFLDGLLGAKG
jgi:AcrR family transcriptional regulator